MVYNEGRSSKPYFVIYDLKSTNVLNVRLNSAQARKINMGRIDKFNSAGYSQKTYFCLV